MIDASSWSPASGTVAGTNAGGYTAVVSWTYEVGSSGTGATLKPNGGDTGKTLFIPNTGYRDRSDGDDAGYGMQVRSWSADERLSTSNTWFLYFASGSDYSSGSISYNNNLNALPVRCVRS